MTDQDDLEQRSQKPYDGRDGSIEISQEEEDELIYGQVDTRQRVLNEIKADVDEGNAHLMTRNELAEFIQWLVTDERSAGLGSIDMNVNEVIYLFMENGDWTPSMQSFAEAAAKKFFVQKQYEK